MPEINVQQTLPLPAVSAGAVMQQALEAVKTLRVELHVLGLPDVGYIAIPVTLEHRGPLADAPGSYPVSIRAERHADAFPVFEGQIGVEADGASASTLRIAGTYTPPLAQAGALLDATLLSNVAQHAMENLLGEFAQEVTRRGRAREMSDVRAHRMD